MLAAAILRTLRILHTYLLTLSETAGGGFEAEWFELMLRQTEHELAPSAAIMVDTPLTTC